MFGRAIRDKLLERSFETNIFQQRETGSYKITPFTEKCRLRSIV